MRYMPVCVKCGKDMKIVQTGSEMVEMFGDPVRPYRITSADRWKCRVCEVEVLAGFGDKAHTEHFHTTKMLEKVKGLIDGDEKDKLVVVFESVRGQEYGVSQDVGRTILGQWLDKQE
jgi:hypothetical protein